MNLNQPGKLKPILYTFIILMGVWVILPYGMNYFFDSSNTVGLQTASANSQYGILGRQSPELNLNTWIDAAGNPMDPIKLRDYRGKVIFGTFNRLIPSHHQDEFYHHCNAVFKSNKKQACDLELVRKDGTRFYARLESVAIQEKAGNSRQIRMAVTDISDRVQTREALRQSEEKYRLLFNEMISGYALHEIIFNSKGKPVDSLILEVNKTI